MANQILCIIFDAQYRGMEQMVARRAHNPKVLGSSPSPATKLRVFCVTTKDFFHF